MRETCRPGRSGLAGALCLRAIIGAAVFGLVGCSSGAGTPAGTGGKPSGGGSGGSGSGSGGANGTNTGGSTTASGTGGAGTGGDMATGTGGGTTSGSGGAGTGGGAASGATGGAGNPGTGGGNTAGKGGTTGAGGTNATGGSTPVGGGTGIGGAGTIDLFNGTDLTGFNVYKASSFANNAPGTLVTGADATAIFKPESGMIHVYADAADKSLQYHYLLQTVASYGKYNLSWEYKWGTKKFQIDATGRGTDLVMFPRDAGVMWHIHGDKTQVWPSSIEFQNKWGTTGDIFAIYAQCKSPGAAGNTTTFAEGGALVSVVGGLTQHSRSANFENPGVGPNASTGEGSDWNTCLLQVDGGTATYSVNGHIVNRVSNVMNSAGTAVTTGYIAWQGEQAEVYYRNLRIQVLP